MSFGNVNSKLNLLSEIVAILYSNNAIWYLCGGAKLDTGLTNEQLLTALGDTWTLDLVNQIVTIGEQLGTLRRQKLGSASCVFNGQASTQIYINWNMLNENNMNKYFLTIIPTLPQRHLHVQRPQVTY